MTSLSVKDGKISTCPYSLISLQIFLLLPLVKLTQCLELPTLVSYFISLSLPSLLFHLLIKILSCNNYVTLVKHVQKPGGFLQTTSNHPHSNDVTLRVICKSLCLGFLAAIGLNCIIANSSIQHFVPLGFYLLLLANFHFGEYFVTSLTNPSSLCSESFLLNHSLAYKIAILSSFLEYAIEAYFLTSFKKFNLISMFGLFLATCGDLIRKIAMFTAGKNFSHLISSTKNPDHKLITHGIYGLMRHPSYAGWFYWALGSQILMLNPICFALFFITSYRFFKDRIEYEESILVNFFQEEYTSYRDRVGTCLPIELVPTGKTHHDIQQKDRKNIPND